MSEEYVTVGSSTRVVYCQDYSPDMDTSEAGSSDIVRSFDVADSPVVGHSPFFATAAEAAGVQQWITVVNMPWGLGDTVYLQAGWVNGMLALRIEETDSGAIQDTQSNQAGPWGLSIAHRDQAESIIKTGDSVNLHGLTCWQIAGYAPAILNDSGGIETAGANYTHNYIYMYIIAGMVCFRHFDSTELNSISASYNTENIIPFGRLPSLGTWASAYSSPASMTFEERQAFDGFYSGYDDTMVDLYAGLEITADANLVAYYESTRQLGTYTLLEFITLRLRRWEHCEHLSITYRTNY